MNYDQWKEQGFDAGLDGEEEHNREYYEQERREQEQQFSFAAIVERALAAAYYDHSRDTEEHVHKRYDLIRQWRESHRS